MSYEKKYIHQLEDLIEELGFEIEAIKVQVENIIMLCEKDHSREAIANYAKHLLTDINGLIGDKDT